MNGSHGEDDIGTEAVVDVPSAPMVIWYPKTQELEVRILDMLEATQYEPSDDASFELLKDSIHNRIKSAFESGEIRTLVQARVLAFEIIIRAAKKGLVIGTGPGSMLAKKQELN